MLKKLKKYIKVYNILIFILFVLFIIIYGCAPDWNKRINKGIDLYKNGEITRARDVLKDALINISGIRKFKGNNINTGSLIYSKDEKISVLYPAEIKIIPENGYDIFRIDAVSGKIGISNGNLIKVFDAKGSLLNTIPEKSGEDGIRGFLLNNDNVYYYTNLRIYCYNSLTGSSDFLVNEKFYAPFKSGFYNAEFSEINGSLITAVGIGGNYNINVIDPVNKSLVINNLKTASSKIYINNNVLFYIEGAAGKYSLNKMPFAGKRISDTFNFKGLKELFFFPAGIIYEDTDTNIWFMEYDNFQPEKISFLEGIDSCANMPVLKYKDHLYIIDLALFIDRYMIIRQEIADL